MIAYLPINAIIKSYKDVVNMLTIFFLFLIAEAWMAFLLFSTELEHFTDLRKSFIYVLSYLIGNFHFDEL